MLKKKDESNVNIMFNLQNGECDMLLITDRKLEII